MKNILVPTDFSENCTKAAYLAIKMAKLYSAEIHFLHLMKTPVDWTKLDKEKEKRYPKTLQEIGVVKSKLREMEKEAEHIGLRCKTFLEFDAGQEDILNHSGHYHHDFIITGSSGTKGIVRELRGSNVEKIIRKSEVPVLVVKDEAVTFPFRDIVFVSAFEEDVTEAFGHVMSLASLSDAKIHFLRINTETDSNSIAVDLGPIERFVKNFPDLEDYAMYVYNEMDVETGINTYLKHNPGDLIAMCTHGSMGFLSLFSGSITERVTNHSSLPVLALKY